MSRRSRKYFTDLCHIYLQYCDYVVCGSLTPWYFSDYIIQLLKGNREVSITRQLDDVDASLTMDALTARINVYVNSLKETHFYDVSHCEINDSK